MSSYAGKTLPAPVIEAADADQYILAIKLLREEWNLGLKEAKDLVDAYIRQNPELSARRKPVTVTGTGALIAAALLLLIAAVAYRLL